MGFRSEFGVSDSGFGVSGFGLRACWSGFWAFRAPGLLWRSCSSVTFLKGLLFGFLWLLDLQRHFVFFRM